ncbi:uncharacterized protein C11orf71 homolog [Talpa occidentalis]|uniref:uncharacterized protein C11orf71 homolog n=1 Tax=Talpa occidentalis TaxID=50954 RepID=UPI00188E45CB|nr:uncharacterized protein C11orf71 homolog [Talpa occidentalis]
MAQNYVALSAGDQRTWGAYRSGRGGLGPPASALARASGDCGAVGGPAAPSPGPASRQAARPSLQPESRRATGGGGRSAARVLTGRGPDGRGREARFSPYPTPGAKLDLLRRALGSA